VHYVALGDRHSVTSVGATGRIWYAGSPEPTSFADTDAGQALVVELDGESISVTPHPVGTWRFLRVTHAFAGDEDVGALEEKLRAVAGKDRTLVRLSLEGTLSLQGAARLDTVLEKLGHVFAGIDTSEGRSDVAVLPAAADFADLDLAGFAREALDELRAAAEGSGAAAGTARDALGLLVRLAGRTP
jgi:DNA repair exonuclease SbcCD nuclease subunit